MMGFEQHRYEGLARVEVIPWGIQEREGLDWCWQQEEAAPVTLREVILGLLSLLLLLLWIRRHG